jgi:SAM-dependent methyltransferase
MPNPPHELASAPSPERIAAWSEHWSAGALHARTASPDENYAGETRAFWLALFAALPRGARVLDLCCGNGPLARLLLDGGLLREHELQLHAIDAARLAPAWLDSVAAPERERLHFHSGVDAARLPFADASFELCISQYGIEYVGAPAMHEVRRVLRAGGRFAAVLHHRDALPVQAVREQLRHIDWLRGAGGPIEAAERAAADAAAATDARASLDEAIARRVASAVWPELLRIAGGALAHALALGAGEQREAAQAHLAQLRDELARIALRQRELVEAALDREQVVALLAPLGECAPWIGELRDSDRTLLGWIALADRAPD